MAWPWHWSPRPAHAPRDLEGSAPGEFSHGLLSINMFSSAALASSESHSQRWSLLGSFLLGVAVTSVYFMALGSPSSDPASALSGFWRLPTCRPQQDSAAQAAQAGAVSLVAAAATLEDPSGQRWNVTESGELCFSYAFPEAGSASDWGHMKWTPPVAPCTVRGLPIEALEPEFNFRRGFCLGFTGDVEDKTHILPFLRAAHDPILGTRDRRVLLDLGGNSFGSSVTWFLRVYPLSFSEIHVWEVQKGLFEVPPRAEADICQPLQLSDLSGVRDHAACALIPNNVLDRIHLREQYVSIEDKPADESGTETVNITRVIKDELKLTAHDTVIVKMDVEYAEWSIIPTWLEDEEMRDIVDELFIEIHYHDPTMAGFGWNRGPQREAAAQLFRDLRSRGFYSHPWP